MNNLKDDHKIDFTMVSTRSFKIEAPKMGWKKNPKSDFTFTFCRRFYPKRLTIGEYMKQFILKRQTDRRSARNTKSQTLFK